MSSKIRNSLLLLAAAAALLSGCKKEDPEEKGEDYDAIVFCRDNYMNTYYYWAEDVKTQIAQIDPSKYNMKEAFDLMLYKDDRWSWMEDAESFIGSQTGTISGTWGISVIQPRDDYEDYGIYVRLILDGSPLKKYGVTRGAQLRAIAGVEIGDRVDTPEKVDAINNHFFDSPNTFTFRLTDGRDTTFSEILATKLSTDYIIAKEIFTSEDFPGLPAPVGYLNYFSFNENFVDAVAKAMKEFSNAGVKKLIIDLRYNGGGSSTASQDLISYIAPKGLAGKPYCINSHNSILSSLDKTKYIGRYDESTKKYSEMSIGADELFFIMYNNTASASEIVFNGLRPYMGKKIHHIGKQTYGKPNGMYVLYYPGDKDSRTAYDAGDYSSLKYVYYPVSFFNTNSEGEKIPSTSEEYSGFIPENERPDDIYHDFNVKESAISACLTYIVSGTYPPVDESKVKSSKAMNSGKAVNIVDNVITSSLQSLNYIEYLENH